MLSKPRFFRQKTNKIFRFVVDNLNQCVNMISTGRRARKEKEGNGNEYRKEHL